MDDSDLESAQSVLDAFARDAALMASLAGVSGQLRAWGSGDTTAGLLAADALDQLEGLIAESEFLQVRETVTSLLRALPRASD